MKAGASLDVAVVREAYPILREMAYFNTGTYGIMAEPVLDRYLESIARFERRGMAAGGFREDIERARARIAAAFNASAPEVTLTGNATDGIAFLSAALELSEGDEVIISDQEHPAMSFPWQYTAERRRLCLRRYRVSGDPGESLASLRGLITPATRLVGTSHVTSPYGVRLPVEEICALAHAHGALALVDGAQSLGAMAVDVQRIGCDFFTGNGHKWLGGPKGTGFLYARRELIERLHPAHVGAGSLERFAEDGLVLWADGRRFEYGTRGFAAPAGLNLALDWLDELGWEAVSGRIEELTTYLKEQLSELPGVKLVTPLEWDRSAGLVTFQVPGRDERALQDQLVGSGLYPRPLGVGSEKIRVSCALFNDEDEIDRLVACVRAFAA